MSMGSSSSDEATRVLRDASLALVVVTKTGTVEHSPYGVTDLAGEFRIDGALPWSEDYSLFTYFDGQACSDPMPITTGNPGSIQEIHLIAAVPKARSARVTGKLTFVGKPHTGSIYWSTKSDSGFAYADEAGEYWFYSSPGTASITATPALRHSNLSSSLGYVDLSETVERELEAESAHRVDFNIELELGEISGTVRSTTGDPVVAIQVHSSGMSYESAAYDSTATDENGDFSFAFQPDEAGYKVSLYCGERHFTFSDLHVDGPRLEIVLPETVGISFRVRDSESGKPVQGVFLAQRKPGDPFYLSQSFDTWPCEGGEPDLLCTEVIDEPHELLVSAPGFVANELGLIDYRDGLVLNVRLDRAIATEIRLDSSNPELPYTTRIYLVEQGYENSFDWGESSSPWQVGRAGRARDSSQVFLDYANGRAVLDGFAPGIYSFRSFPPGLVFEPATIELSHSSAGHVLLNYTTE